ncbi:MBL fold metallo-hydrolase [Christensenella intestinihominis]|uniref:MBL fold metallo-hydrolase n=1 Tax=Christensenella intestinihominis TaxID=1851429 RepID=UPI0008309E94|nr:MBL fold metallo-hydrolase [Christensenella intestinihominis]
MKITEHVIMLDASRGSRCFLLFDDELALVDTGFPFMRRGILRELEQLGVALPDIRHILLTHHDTDHAGCVRALREATGAEVWAHAEDIPYLTGERPRPGKKKYIARLLGKKPMGEIRPYGGDLRVGNIRILHTPGHTPGHVCMLFDGVLFAGDLLKANKKGDIIPYPDGWNADTPKLLESFEAIQKIDYDWLCPSHSRPQRRL